MTLSVTRIRTELLHRDSNVPTVTQSPVQCNKKKSGMNFQLRIGLSKDALRGNARAEHFSEQRMLKFN